MHSCPPISCTRPSCPTRVCYLCPAERCPTCRALAGVAPLEDDSTERTCADHRDLVNVEAPATVLARAA